MRFFPCTVFGDELLQRNFAGGNNMLDLTKAEDLAKGGKSIGNFFLKQAAELEKNFAFHKAMAVHHAAASAQHTTHAATLKAHHAGLPDDDVHKAAVAASSAHETAMAGHHDGMAKACEGHAETMKSEIDGMKKMAADWGVTKPEGAVTSLLSRAAGTGTVTVPPTTPTGNPMVDMVNETAGQLMAKTLSMMDTDPEVQQAMREQVLKMISEAIGKTVVPTGVSVVAPPNPRAVTRPGQPPLPAATPAAPNVPLEFVKLFSTEDNEQERSIL
jgi:hypothetical protein